MKENKPMQKQDLFSSTLSELIWEQIFWISGLKLAIYVQLKFWVIQLFISEGPGSNLVKNVSVFISKINCQKFAQKHAQNCLQSLISLIVLVFWNKTSNRYDSILRWIWTENGLFSLFKLLYSHTPILEMLSHLKIQ